ncbi:hypothetical protein A8W25_30705 [Streptomyces sp. ERV7]|nr:hypothetical protein A8W25_30705 [Streptomyces sp. ERV7]
MTRILRNARARRDPRDIPGFEALLGPAHQLGLTQDHVGALAGKSPRWYRNLETGKDGNYSEEFLQAVRRILDLTEAEWETVYRLVRHRTPPPTTAAPTVSQSTRLPPAVRALLDHETWPAYVCDHRWDVLAYNAPMATYFTWLLHGENVMFWALTYQEARRQLIDWEDAWAIPMITQLRFHAERWPHDARMQAVVDGVLADPDARRLWKSSNLPTPAMPDANQPRRLYLPGEGPKIFSISLLAAELVSMPGCRLMILAPA